METRARGCDDPGIMQTATGKHSPPQPQTGLCQQRPSRDQELPLLTSSLKEPLLAQLSLDAKSEPGL